MCADAYDDNDLPGPWGSLTIKILDPDRPGTYHFLLGYVSPPGVILDTDGDIVLAG